MERQPSIGQRLAAARLRRGLGQALVAQRAGIAPSYLSRIENSRVQPSFRTVLRLTRAIGIRFDEIAPHEPLAHDQPGACPVSAQGHCLLDLVHPDTRRIRTRDVEFYSQRRLRMLRKFAAWLRRASADRERAMEVLLDDLLHAPPIDPEQG